MKIVLGALAVTGAAGGGVYAYRVATKPAELTYRTVKIERGNIVARVAATGTLSAHVTVQVGSQVSGRVHQLMVDFNSSVKKGQVIAKIDPSIFEAAVAQARANAYAAQGNLTKAKAQALDAQRKLERAKQLRADGLASIADVETADTALEVAKAQIEASKGELEQARASQHQAEVNLAYTTIVSPIDGTVISRSVDVGQTVAASLQAPVLFTIAEDLRKMQVDTNVTEGDVGKLRSGMPATFLVDAYPNERFRGTIQQIRNAPQTVQNVVTYDAVIDVENEELKLKPGMTANVTIVYDRREGVLRVPNAALRFRPPPALASAYPSASASAPRPSWNGPPSLPSSDAPSGSAAPAASVSAAPASSGSAAPAPSGSSGRRRGRFGGGFGPGGGSFGPGGGGGDDASGAKTLWVMRGEKPQPVVVRVGLTDGTSTEILSGDVNEGDSIVLEAQSSDDPAPSPSSRPGGAGGPRMRL
ncbi:Macrolide-specific efflux protein MacA [Minicystis rosea]|nr:Macrolide-specific efflux protein MacA [Minicystis rosea]